MARAEAIEQEKNFPDIIEQAGNAMLLLITRSTWETLILQGRSEGLSPGQVLDKALRQYLEQHGCQEAVDYLFHVAGQKRE